MTKLTTAICLNIYLSIVSVLTHGEPWQNIKTQKEALPMKEYQYFRVELEGHIATITISRPKALNEAKLPKEAPRSSCAFDGSMII